MSENVLEITDNNFEEEVVRADMPVMLDLWAPWCGPCQMVAPIIEDLAEEYKGKVKIGKLNVDENPTTAAQFGISSIPTMMFFQDGKEVSNKRLIGVRSRKDYSAVLKELTSN